MVILTLDFSRQASTFIIGLGGGVLKAFCVENEFLIEYLRTIINHTASFQRTPNDPGLLPI